MLLMIEGGIRGGITHAIHGYAEANNKYMKNYDKKKESSYLEYLVANNLFGWAMSQKLPVYGIKWKKDLSLFDKKFIKSYGENSNKGCILELDGKYSKYLHDLHSDLPFLPERLRINKCDKLVCNLFDKKLYCPHKDLKTSIKLPISFLKSA